MCPHHGNASGIYSASWTGQRPRPPREELILSRYSVLSAESSLLGTQPALCVAIEGGIDSRRFRLGFGSRLRSRSHLLRTWADKRRLALTTGAASSTSRLREYLGTATKYSTNHASVYVLLACIVWIGDRAEKVRQEFLRSVAGLGPGLDLSFQVRRCQQPRSN